MLCLCRVLSLWRDKSGIAAESDANAAAASTDDPSSPVVITVNIDGIMAWLEGKELQKAIKKTERFSGADDAAQAIAETKVCCIS